VRVEVASEIKAYFNGNIEGANGKFVILYLQVINRGRSTDDFTGVGVIRLRDDDGNRYSESHMASFFAEANAQNVDLEGYLCVDINPDQSCKAVVVFDVPTGLDHFVIVDGILTTDFSGNVSVELP